MPRLEFERIDLPIEIRELVGGSVLLRIGSGGLRRGHTLMTVDALQPSWRTLDVSPAASDLAGAIWEWMRTANRGAPARFGDRVMLPRVVLRIDDARLAALDWEQEIAAHYFGDERLPFVRASAVRPRAAGLPLTFPVRALQIGPSPDYLVSQHWVQMFRHFGADGLGNALIAEECPATALGGTCTYRDWPTIDVLHFDDFLSLAPDRDVLWQTAAPDTTGTLGWLNRIADLNQTRLIVLRAWSYEQVALLRRLAAAVAARGGPAVVVVGAPAPSARRFLERFYERLVHDDPLDAAFSDARGERPNDWQAMHTLIVGSGREELLRASTIGVGLMALNAKLADSAQGATREWGELEDLAVTSGMPGMARGVLEAELAQLENEWSGYDFADSERDGLIPLSRRVRSLRAAIGVVASAPPVPRPPGPRYVNSSLWLEHPDGRFARIEPRGARLTVGETCHLEVLIGPKDTSIRTVGAAALIEEVFKWTPAMSGVWVEIGVIGLEFDVLGDPVQELWLPKDGVAYPVYFAVSPRRAGVARLRFCLYFGNDVVQSFRIAAVTVVPGESGASDDQARHMLAQALGLDPNAVGGEGYLALLEYSLADGLDDAPERPGRKVSFVANHLDDDPVIAVKASNVFDVRINRNVPDRVSQVRKALAEVSVRALDVPPEKRPYAFGPDNRGDADTLKNALRKLAVAGRDLYAAILSQSARDELDELLADPQIIHVAHVLLEDVIPWAAIYDRAYDEGRTIDRHGAPVDQEVCLASLPAAAGGVGARKCGTVGECELHAERLRRRREQGDKGLIPETVVCPLHFWGFKHVVEVPAQQVKGQRKARVVWNRIGSAPLANLLAAINATLDPEQVHAQELDSLIGGVPPPGTWVAKLSDRTTILNELERADLDLIYFYCHARGGREHPAIDPPILEIQVSAQPAQGWIKPADLSSSVRWEHHPLIFLNGCGTAGFSPDALSPFITALVEDRGAAGVVGTEIPVHEVFAREFARHFLGAFIAGRRAGDALLEARRKLLEKNNPLGLIYTLYATADLQLERK
jgi:hypothetical protein